MNYIKRWKYKMADINKLKGLLKNDAARARVQRLNKQGEAAVKGATEGDSKLLAYKNYVDRFYELKEQFPNWEERLDKPIEYSRFVLDYNEEVYKMIGNSSGKTAIETYTLKMHGINLQSIEILKEELNKLMPGSKWTNPEYFRTHIREAYQELRQFYPDDEEYDEVFSPKEEKLFFGE